MTIETRQSVFRIETSPVLEFRRGPWRLPVFVRSTVLGEVREGETVNVVDSEGNDYGDVSVRSGRLLVSGAEHIAGYSGSIELTRDGAVIGGKVFLQHRYPRRSPLEPPPMIEIYRQR